MRIAVVSSLAALGFLAVAGSVARISAQGPAPPAPAQTTTPPSGSAVQVVTRMVSLDVVATDSHGNPVRDLKQQELQIFEEHNNAQTISRFEFVDGAIGAPAPPATSAAASSAPAVPVYSNRLPIERLSVAPTVLLIDGLNTDTPNQMYARKQMLTLLKTLPSNVPVAVFLMSNSLRLLQGFTTDPSLLQAALSKALNAQTLDQNPADDPDSVSNMMLDLVSDDGSTGVTEDQVEQIQDFEKEEYAHTMDIRVETTIDSMTAIGQYLGGIPGRKNLIWVSQSFPISIMAQPDVGKDPFRGTRQYGDQVESVSKILTDAQVALYPVDAAGLATNDSLSASQTFQPHVGARTPDGGFSARVQREENNRDLARGTMDTFAKETGGKVCTNTNDLSKCVNLVLKESATYYELGFYPQNITWDGRFHHLTLKTTRPGVKLAYRAGYFASDAAAAAKSANPDSELRDACSRLMPSTGIGLSARIATAAEMKGAPSGFGYQVFVSPADVTFTPAAGAHRLDLVVAFCTYGSKTNSASLTKEPIAVSVADNVMQRWQSTGIPDLVAVRPDPGLQRVRVVVLDLPTASVGAIDIPIHPDDLARAAAAPPAGSPAPVRAAIQPQIDIPDKAPAPTVASQLNFKGSSGDVGTLHWEGTSLAYAGALAVDQSAPAFFKYAFGTSLRCDGSNLVPVAQSAGEPKLQITFRAADGRFITVDMKGSEVLFSGDLALDPSAQKFFEAVWKLSHCQALGN